MDLIYTRRLAFGLSTLLITDLLIVLDGRAGVEGGRGKRATPDLSIKSFSSNGLLTLPFLDESGDRSNIVTGL